MGGTREAAGCVEVGPTGDSHHDMMGKVTHDDGKRWLTLVAVARFQVGLSTSSRPLAFAAHDSSQPACFVMDSP